MRARVNIAPRMALDYPEPLKAVLAPYARAVVWIADADEAETRPGRQRIVRPKDRATEMLHQPRDRSRVPSVADYADRRHAIRSCFTCAA